MEFPLSFDLEEDGRWIASIELLPGVMAYGSTHAEASSRVKSLALRVIEERRVISDD